MKKMLFTLLTLFALLGAVSAKEIVLETGSFQSLAVSLPIIIGLALIDSINPCVIGVLILLMTVLLKTGRKETLLKNGAAYIIGVYVTYLLGGLTLLGIFNAVRSIAAISQMLYTVVGAFVLLAGFLEIKDYFWYGRWFSLAIPQGFVGYIEKRVTGVHANLWAAFTFGVILTLIELPCTGAPYLAVLTLMSQSGYGYITALPLLLFYNVIFVLPLVAVVYLAYAGTKMKRLEGWRKDNRGLMRLLVGLALLAIGIWIVTAVSDIFVPLTAGIVGVIALMGVLKYVFKV